MLCPSPGWQIRVRVRVITSESESESESSPQSPSPSHHLKVRVRVITSESESKKKIRVRVTNLVVHIFNICLSSKTWKQTTKCIECQSKQRNMARPVLLGLGRDSGPSHESWFLSPSQSENYYYDSSPSKMDSSHTALTITRLTPWFVDMFIGIFQHDAKHTSILDIIITITCNYQKDCRLLFKLKP